MIFAIQVWVHAFCSEHLAILLKLAYRDQCLNIKALNLPLGKTGYLTSTF